MHTVFVNDKALRFASSYEVEDWKGNTSSMFVSENDLSIEEAIYELEETENYPGMIYMSANADVSWKVFISYCKLSEAAGGLVMNEEDKFLVILRHGKWDLPKGKLEYDESPEEGAVREVQEECGVEKLELVKPLEKTFHTYHLKKNRVLKKTHWFLMRIANADKLTPQKEEDIQEACWMTKKEIREKVYANTYNSIKELLGHFI